MRRIEVIQLYLKSARTSPAPQFQQQQELQNTALDTFCEVRVKTHSFMRRIVIIYLFQLYLKIPHSATCTTVSTATRTAKYCIGYFW